MASDRGAERDHGGGVVGWGVLIEALMRAVVIEMAHVPVKNNAGVSRVVDQQTVGAFGADAANEPFCVAVRLGRARGPSAGCGGLSDPGRCGVSGHAEKMDPAGADLHHEQNVKAAQRDGVEGEEIGGQQPASLRVQEGPPPGVGPARRRAEPSGSQDPPNRAGTDAMPETGVFTLDPAVAPGRVLPCQAQHQTSDFVGDPWAA